MTIKLHCFGKSRGAYKVALTPELADMCWEPIFVGFFIDALLSIKHHKRNVMVEAPLLAHDHLTLLQSGAIQQWVLDKTGKLGGAPVNKYEVLR